MKPCKPQISKIIKSVRGHVETHILTYTQKNIPLYLSSHVKTKLS